MANSENLRRKEDTGHDIRKIVLLLVTFFGGTIFLGVLFEKYGDGVPDWALLLLGFTVVCLFAYWLWTSEPVTRHYSLIYTFPRVALMILVFLGAVFGGAFGGLLWWSVYKQQPRNIENAPDQPKGETTPTPSAPLDELGQIKQQLADLYSHLQPPATQVIEKFPGLSLQDTRCPCSL